MGEKVGVPVKDYYVQRKKSCMNSLHVNDEKEEQPLSVQLVDLEK